MNETDLEEFTSSQIARLKKEYESLRGKETGVSPEKFAKLRKMMDRFQKPNLLALAKADIPILSSAAKAKLVIKFGMKWKSLPEDFIPYIEIFADSNKELNEQKKGNLPMDICFLWDSIGSVPCQMSVEKAKNNND